jgi:rhodanese-related sulfurtransferase
MATGTITCKTLKRYFDEEKPFVLLDVRDPEEFELCRIDGSILTPLSELEDHLPDFDPTKDYVVYCKLGGRGEKACLMMKEKGFSKVRNLQGGIVTWRDKIEGCIEQY